MRDLKRTYLVDYIVETPSGKGIGPSERAYLLARCLQLEARVAQLETLLKIDGRVEALKQAQATKTPAHPGVNRPGRGKGSLVPPEDIAMMREYRRQGMYAHEVAALMGWPKKTVWNNWNEEGYVSSRRRALH